MTSEKKHSDDDQDAFLVAYLAIIAGSAIVHSFV